MSDTDPEKLADELDEQADQLERQSDELKHDVTDVRDDWERKRADQSVPGAVPRDEGDEPPSSDSEDSESD